MLLIDVLVYRDGTPSELARSVILVWLLYAKVNISYTMTKSQLCTLCCEVFGK